MFEYPDEKMSEEGDKSFDVEQCRVKPMSEGEDYELVECLTPRDTFCVHAISFGYRCLCRHPRRRDIVEGNLAFA